MLRNYNIYIIFLIERRYVRELNERNYWKNKMIERMKNNRLNAKISTNEVINNNSF